VEATRCLREEHRLIERVLDCFEIALRASAASGEVKRAEYAPFLEFFGDFADLCHHAKEEEGLFAQLEPRGAASDGTPIAQALEEHAWNRALLAGVRESLDRIDSGERKAARNVIEQGRAYRDALGRHIDKEEHCLFGLAERTIHGPALDELLRAYRRVEGRPGYRDRLERCRRVADGLFARHGVAPPRPAHGGATANEAPPAAFAEGDPPWRGWAAPLMPEAGSELATHVERALSSRPVARLQVLLERAGRRMDPRPMLWKRLPGPHLRLFFPVHGGSDAVERADVVAVVLLHDVANERTLYAHPIHAGPAANPLLAHVGGPMARPKAQEGENGDRATRRLLAHKDALWSRFESEREACGAEEAGRRWRERYAWALVRLYFCERCPACRWGSPGFDGAGRLASAGARDAGLRADGAWGAAEPTRAPGREALASRVRASEGWQIELCYARRGGFAIREEPSLILPLAEEHVLAVFPSDAEQLEGGAIVGAAAWLHRPARAVRHVHCLVAGPEAEPVFLHGDRALGLPQPGAGRPGAREAYVRWRHEAWRRFWLDELELGLRAASRRWLQGYASALATLAGAPG